MVKITHDAWGSITVNGKSYKDVFITPDTEMEWVWLPGMRHDPGLRVEDVNTLILPYQPELVILSTGREGKLKVDPRYEDALKTQAGVKFVFIGGTEECINMLKKLDGSSIRVVALIHTTC